MSSRRVPHPTSRLDTLIEDGLIVSAIESGGVLTVDLDPTIFDRVPSTQQTEAIGQIVLTMLGSLRGIGQVTFTLGGEAVAVKKGNGQLSDVGEPLSYDAFANLLAAPRTSPTRPPRRRAPGRCRRRSISNRLDQ